MLLKPKLTQFASISFQISGNLRILFCRRNTSVPVFYSSLSTAIVVFKSGDLSSNSRVSFTYQIAGEPWYFKSFKETYQLPVMGRSHPSDEVRGCDDKSCPLDRTLNQNLS